MKTVHKDKKTYLIPNARPGIKVNGRRYIEDPNQKIINIEIDAPGLTTQKHYKVFCDELARLLPGIVQLSQNKALGVKPPPVNPEDFTAFESSLECVLPDALDLAKYQIDRG